jgi:hypothetical protein
VSLPLQGGAVNFSTADHTDTDNYAPLFCRLGEVDTGRPVWTTIEAQAATLRAAQDTAIARKLDAGRRVDRMNGWVSHFPPIRGSNRYG